jgi:hypothetical protein
MVTVRSNAAELYSLPWELITIGPSGQHLGELPEVLLRYAWRTVNVLVEHRCISIAARLTGQMPTRPPRG